jgi:hypothetical protein
MVLIRQKINQKGCPAFSPYTGEHLILTLGKTEMTRSINPSLTTTGGFYVEISLTRRFAQDRIQLAKFEQVIMLRATSRLLSQSHGTKTTDTSKRNR